MRLLLVLGLALASAEAGAQIYKCTGADGRITLTDKPCARNEVVETITIPPPPETGLEKMQRIQAEERAASDAKHSKLIGDLQEAHKVLKAESERQQAIYSRRVAREGLVIGMPFTEVNDHPVWGLPRKINNTTTANGTRSQWIYPASVSNEYDVIYLYFVQGRLTTIQN